ncbi:MAG: NFYB/HAP3 family transcription factor subunit [Candidatus Woesearchaeota archaeon]|nr:NFYB/HAP3 family transcription factor subunit [Candidatus Woesearchaeota archaeon]
MDIPTLAAEKLLRNAGAKRVGEDAKERIREIIKKEASEIARKAKAFSEHAGRKTIKKEDIDLVLV